ncbi:MAG: hypothetical protein WC876_05260 [Candidatus Thermoplasmatota archaeon]|jgi:hypothetical protein
MAPDWQGTEKGKIKERAKVFGGRRKPGGVVVPKAKPDAPAKPR